MYLGVIIPELESQNTQECHINKTDKYLEYLNSNIYYNSDSSLVYHSIVSKINLFQFSSNYFIFRICSFQAHLFQKPANHHRLSYKEYLVLVEDYK